MATRPETIDDFTDKVKQLYESDPEKVRLVLKYRHTDGVMTLRATNDELWLIYKTDQSSDMRRLEAMQLWMTASMCGSSVESLTEAAEDDVDTTVTQTGGLTNRRRGKKSKRK
uniref:SRP9 domain-containing protein n=1 Tax=Aureoumbra lagunensis TaxID=44058 RepID=A0A6S8EFS7_9STRA|mmetsp:Transcript_11600/g.15778  ORF Transcript_11600/g.15778 Transcript_11600/m.15778 type:complete len:113 (+) Transcript_11600:235-573(+)|eukprot:CAMPEP_0197285792 /NCGR_PEP_ID=MMETSP0890-20130614/1138_1 /TAXON_ID=44058 ORGANISM="Aureoumbra lagunensis, Strain CCMP1510" /NCGR_SAMPLE_ID=MMETSP0890 /ASSEMBLY_ACC=CAM_ASM_000533 /LENGTH=112 /DNA_ID=CAMNT_0042753613 /DNA_START=215 /DNA_END=553 /DNA_ORIENTATION=-